MITVLYEDELARAEPKRFGPHVLLIACLEDDLKTSRRDLEDVIKAVPKKGDGNLRIALRRDIGRQGPAVALFDHDRCRAAFGLQKSACKSQVLAAAQELAPSVRLVLLEQNVESLIATACRVMGDSVPISKPTPLQRDEILQKLAWLDAKLRLKLRRELQSFDRLVQRVLEVVPERLKSGKS